LAVGGKRCDNESWPEEAAALLVLRWRKGQEPGMI
jgi:hypothetical protein